MALTWNVGRVGARGCVDALVSYLGRCVERVTAPGSHAPIVGWHVRARVSGFDVVFGVWESSH